MACSKVNSEVVTFFPVQSFRLALGVRLIVGSGNVFGSPNVLIKMFFHDDYPPCSGSYDGTLTTFMGMEEHAFCKGQMQTGQSVTIFGIFSQPHDIVAPGVGL